MRRGSVVILLLVLGFGSPKPTRQVSPADTRQQMAAYLSDVSGILEHQDKESGRYLEVFNLRKTGSR